MSNYDKGLPSGLREIPQEIMKHLAIGGVQVPCRLICQNYLRLVHERASNRDSLLFSTRQF